jgi:hypothetical protein
MVNVVFSGDSAADLQLLIELAKKLGIQTQVLSEEEWEDIGLGLAMSKGKTQSYLDTEAFIKKLRDGGVD